MNEVFTVEPARLADLARLMPLWEPRALRCMIVQMARSVAVAIEAEGELLALAGLYPQPEALELWLAVRPGLRGTPAGHRLTWRLLSLATALPSDVPVTLAVRADHGPGLTLARRAGFQVAEELFGGRVVRFVRR